MSLISSITKEVSSAVKNFNYYSRAFQRLLDRCVSRIAIEIDTCRSGTKPLADLAHWEGIDLAEKIAEKMAINEARGTRGRKV